MGGQAVERNLRSATKLFASRGIADVNIQDVATSPGVASGTVIYHVKSQKQLAIYSGKMCLVVALH